MLDWPTEEEECKRCSGSGYIEVRDWRTGYRVPLSCPDCYGTGYAHA